MSIVPTRVDELLAWANVHQDVWSSVATQIGLTAAQATAFKNAWTAASTDFNARETARAAAEAAATTSQNSIRDLRRSASDTIRFIKAFAETQDAPDTIYAKAQIPPPAAPTPVGPPGTPFDFRAALNPDGTVTFRWKCNNPAGSSGTVYTIKRKLSNESQFLIIGAVGLRRFTDMSLPLGTPSVQYVAVAQRGEQVGLPSSPFTVQFGTGGGGLQITAQFTESGDGQSQARLAA
jgi:hypothetical protein